MEYIRVKYGYICYEVGGKVIGEISLLDKNAIPVARMAFSSTIFPATRWGEIEVNPPLKWP
jgi:hypothetical protein